MGIKGFKNFLRAARIDNTRNINDKIVLAVDASTYIYAALAAVLPPGSSGDMSLEKFKIALNEAFMNELQKIIDMFVRDAITHIYVAFDGVAATAKIIEQRRRRCESTSAVQIKHGGVVVYDSRMLVPAAGVIRELYMYVCQHIEALGIPNWNISGPGVPGEGEHKLVSDTRGIESSVVLCSNDNDVAVLQMMSAIKWPRYVLTNTELVHINKMSAIYGINDENMFYNYVLASCFLGNDFVPAPAPFNAPDRNAAAIMVDALTTIGHTKCFDGTRLQPEMLSVVIRMNEETARKYPSFRNRVPHYDVAADIVNIERVHPDRVGAYMIVAAIEWWLTVESVLAHYVQMTTTGLSTSVTMGGFYARQVCVPLDYLQAGFVALMRIRAPRKTGEMDVVIQSMKSFASPYVCRIVDLGVVEDLPSPCAGPVWANYTSRDAQANVAIPLFAFTQAALAHIVPRLKNIIERYGNHGKYLGRVLAAKSHLPGINLFSPLHWRILMPASHEPVESPVIGHRETSASVVPDGRTLTDQLAFR